jgi:hypothetical protein
MNETKRQLVNTDARNAYCQCCGTTETPYACLNCRTPLCTACAHFDGCPRCDLTDDGFAPECTQ